MEVFLNLKNEEYILCSFLAILSNYDMVSRKIYEYDEHQAIMLNLNYNFSMCT